MTIFGEGWFHSYYENFIVVGGLSEAGLYRIRSSVFSYSLYVLWGGYRLLYRKKGTETGTETGY